MEYFIDSNIFLRVLIKDNHQFSECYNFLKAIKQNKIAGFTNSLVLAEIAWTLLSFYQVPKAKVIESIKGILQLNGLKIKDKVIHLTAIELYENHTIKVIDALIASQKDILAKKICIVSYDTDFDKLNLLRKEPHEFI